MSNLPPSSALTDEGKRKASKHPHSHMNKSIFSLVCGENSPLLLLFVILCLSKTKVQSKVPFPLFLATVSLKRNTSSVQNPLKMPGFTMSYVRVPLLLLSGKLNATICENRTEMGTVSTRNKFLKPQNPFRCAQTAALCPPVSHKARGNTDFVNAGDRQSENE